MDSDTELTSVLALFEILIDKNETTANRIEAAKQILEYEAPAKAVVEAKAYLTTVFNNRKLGASLRLEAIKLMRKSEARKITRPPVQPGEDLARRMEAANRRIGRIPAGEVKQQDS
jgi:hypothetical protein